MGSMTIMCHNGRPIAKTNHSLISKNLPPEEILANARLIAAAPDLYESLKGFLEHVLHNYDLTERENKKFAELANSGLAAITKAETV